MTKSIDELKAQVAHVQEGQQREKAMIAGLSQQLKDALAQIEDHDDPDVQEATGKLKAIADEMDVIAPPPAQPPAEPPPSETPSESASG